MASKVESADVRYMRQSLAERSFKHNAKNKLGDVRLKLDKAEDLCQVLMEENGNLSEEVRILRGRFQDTQHCIDQFSNEKEEVCKDLNDLKTILAQREQEFAAEKGKLESDKMSVTLTLERLRNEMRRLREENEEGRHRLSLMDGVLQSRNKEGENLQREKSEITEVMQKKTATLELQVSTLKRDCEEAKAVTNDAEKNCGNFKAQIERAKGQLDATVKWNKTLTESKDRLRKEYQQVTESLSSLKVEHDVYRTENQKKLEETGQRLVNKEKELVVMIREKNRCETVIDDLRKRIRVCEEARDELTLNLEDAKQGAHVKLQEKESEINKLISYSKGKEKMLKQTEFMIANKELEIQKLQEQLEDCKDDIYKMSKDKNALKEKQERSELLLREWSAKYDTLDTEMKDQEIHYEEQLSIVKNDLKEVQTECEQYARDNKDLEESVAELTQENRLLHSNLKNLETDAAALKNDVVQLHEKKLKFDEDLKALSAHKRSLEREKADVTNARNILAQENEGLKAHQEEIMSEFEKLKKELELVITVKNDFKKDVESLKTKLDEAKAKHEAREQFFDKIKSEMSSDLEHHKAKLRQSKQERDLAKKSFEQEKADLNMAKDNLTQENENLKIHQEEVLEEFEKMKKEFEILIVLKNDMRRDLERRKLELDENKRRQEQAELEAEETKAEMEKEVETYKTLAKEATEDADRCQKQRDAETKSLKKAVSDLEGKLTMKEQELEELTGKCQVVEEELIKEKTVRVEAQAPGNQWLDPTEEIGLFRPRENSSPVPKTPTPGAPPPTITLGEAHTDILSKLNTRWNDVLDERKQIKDAMTNFYSLIDVLITSKDCLQDALKSQKDEFEKKLEEVSLNQSRSDCSERREIVGLQAENLDVLPSPEAVNDPKVVEANVNELLRETNLYEGHIQYLKQQIGSHYGKAAKALDKHKSTMHQVMKMPNGQSLIANAASVKSGRSRYSSMNSVCSNQEQEPNYISEDGLKSLSDKHFQMINELTSLRKQLSEMKDEHSRLRMENKYLKRSESPSPSVVNGSRHGVVPQYSPGVSSLPAAASSGYASSGILATMPKTTPGFTGRSTPRVREDAGRPTRSLGDTDKRYRAAVESLRNELRIS